MKIQILFLLLLILFLTNCQSADQSKENLGEIDIQIVGAMKNVMQKGELKGVFDLASIAKKQHTYGLGPIEYLQGELLIFDGKAYQSKVSTNSSIMMQNDFQVKAPFFVYAEVEAWEEQNLPDQIKTISQLEIHLNETIKSRKRPFVFKLSGKVETASIHVVNLPKGTTVRSHKDAHQGIVNYELSNEMVDILGFFSTKHQGVFTHHDSYLHMHLLTADKTKMGHLDKVNFDTQKMKLFLPQN